MQGSQVAPLRWLGWRQVGIAALMDFASTGLFFYSFGVFVPHVEAAMGLTRSASSLGVTIYVAIGALAAPVVGRYLDSNHLHRVMAVGALLLGVGLGTIGAFPTIGGAVAGILLAGIGGATLGMMAPARLISNWFVRRRGTAMGIAAVGISASGVVMPVLANAMIHGYGWQESLLIYGALGCLAVAPIAWFFTVTFPEHAGQTPDNAPAEWAPKISAPTPAELAQRPGLREIYRTAPFRFAVFTFGAQFFATGAILAHLVPLGLSMGMTGADAALMASGTAFFAVLGKLVFGYMGDRLPIWMALSVSATLQMLGVLLANLLPQPWPALAAIVALFGLGFGANVVLQNLMLARFFGQHMGIVMATTRPPVTALQVCGPLLTGYLFDLHGGSYEMALWIHSGVYGMVLLGALVFARARWSNPRYHPFSRPFSGRPAPG